MSSTNMMEVKMDLDEVVLCMKEAVEIKMNISDDLLLKMGMAVIDLIMEKIDQRAQQ